MPVAICLMSSRRFCFDPSCQVRCSTQSMKLATCFRVLLFGSNYWVNFLFYKGQWHRYALSRIVAVGTAHAIMLCDTLFIDWIVSYGIANRIYPDPHPCVSHAKIHGDIFPGENILGHASQSCGAFNNPGAIFLKKKQQP